MKNLIRRYQRYQAKRTPSLLAGVLFLLGGGAFVGNIPIEGYSSSLIGLFLILAGLLIHLESMGNQQAEQVRLLEELADAEGDS